MMYANTRNHLVQAMIEELTQAEIGRFLECSADAIFLDRRNLPNGWPRHQDWHEAAVTDAAAEASEPGASEPTPVTPTEAGAPAGSVQAAPEAIRAMANLKEEAQRLFAKIREVGGAVKEGQPPGERGLVRPVPQGEPPPGGPDAQGWRQAGRAARRNRTRSRGGQDGQDEPQ